MKRLGRTWQNLKGTGIKTIFTFIFQVTDAGETSDVEKSEMVGATLTQSTTIKPDETQVNGETVSTTPKETIADAPTEQTVADPQISSSSQVNLKK